MRSLTGAKSETAAILPTFTREDEETGTVCVGLSGDASLGEGALLPVSGDVTGGDLRVGRPSFVHAAAAAPVGPE